MLLSRSNRQNLSPQLRGETPTEPKLLARQELGYNPREGGDEFVTQSNNLQFGEESQELPQESEDAEE